MRISACGSGSGADMFCGQCACECLSTPWDDMVQQYAIVTREGSGGWRHAVIAGFDGRNDTVVMQARRDRLRDGCCAARSRRTGMVELHADGDSMRRPHPNLERIRPDLACRCRPYCPRHCVAPHQSTPVRLVGTLAGRVCACRRKPLRRREASFAKPLLHPCSECNPPRPRLSQSGRARSRFVIGRKRAVKLFWK